MSRKISVLFMGRKKTGLEALMWLIKQKKITIKAIIFSDLKKSTLLKLVKNKKIQILKRNKAERTMGTGQIKIDLGISVLYREKIRPPILENCRLGVINFHPAPLPDYKGNAGYNIAILKNLKQWAASAHYVDEAFDTGPIIKNRWFKINASEETALSLEKKTSREMLVLFRETLSLFISRQTRLPSKSNIGGIYVSRLQMEAMKKIKSSDNIDKKIRAFWYPPYSGATISLKGKNYTLVNEYILKQIADSYSKGT